ncbi:ATP-binding protein [Chitinophaga tropicalis]|uniref:histidine kinase n=1 Tax=Chitinophaga tropicalis TaxID=2683588 RepID=A0A7K1U3D0_9BACT|nr:ATP-binding protein [Chitinophaga tropicalis]MVT08874.1 response regulator [Chitinophaga tropicalis]
MSKNNNRATFTRFGFTALLVILLVAVFMIAFLQQKNSRQMAGNVEELISGQQSIGVIDHVLQRLYTTENYFRLYTLNYKTEDYLQYVRQLKLISSSLDSIQEKKNEGTNLRGLLSEKKAKELLYIHLKYYTDSLLSLVSGIDTNIQEAPVISLPATRPIHLEKNDTIITEKKEENKKRLFGRLKDAIANKGQSQRQVTILKQEKDRNTVAANAAVVNNGLRKLQSHFNELRQKEHEMIAVNMRLFGKLRDLLSALKTYETIETDTRQEQLHQRFSMNLADLDRSIIWSVALIVVLTFMILYSIVKLYRNDLQMIKAKKEAENFATLKSEFVATMSHEIRSPLNSVLGFASLLERTPLNSEQQKLAEGLTLSGEMLLSVVNNILDHTSLEMGKMTLTMESFAPAGIIRNVVNSLLVQVEKKQLNLLTKISFTDNLKITGDPFRLSQVITNLVSNAIKFTDKGGITVTADVSREADKVWLQVKVADTGIGISEEEQKKIFEPFHQAMQTGQRADSSGLGLTIISRIISKQQGNIKVQSIPGKGSTFTFRIPYHAEPVIKEKTEIADNEMNNPKAERRNIEKKVSLLVVDDSIVNRSLLEILLKRLDTVQPTIVSSGEEALAHLKKQDYDMVWTDIEMPFMNGLELNMQIKALPDKHKASIPVIAITGNVLEEQLEAYNAAGMAGYILKPYRIDDLSRIITNYSR